MNISEFRKQYLEKIENDVKGQPTFRDFLNEVKAAREGIDELEPIEESDSAREEVAEAVSILRDQGEEVGIRIKALDGIIKDMSQQEELIELIFSILENSEEPVNLRIAVLSVCGELQFSSTLFRAKRAQFLDLLKSIVDDSNSELSSLAIERLAKSKDEYVQRRLFEGLKNSAESLVPPEKAIQLLGYDVHADYFPVLEQIVNKPPNLLAKNEAVRLLGTNPKARNLLVELLLDKNENKRIRQTSASALNSLAQFKLNKVAEQIVLDDADYDDIRATCINLLTDSKDFPDDNENFEITHKLGLAGSTELYEKINELSQKTTISKELKKAAERYVVEYNK